MSSGLDKALVRLLNAVAEMIEVTTTSWKKEEGNG